MAKDKIIVVVRSELLASVVPWSLNIFCPDSADRAGELTTDHAASSQGLPVFVVGGVAYGPADLGPHSMTFFSGGAADYTAARLAGYTVTNGR